MFDDEQSSLTPETAIARIASLVEKSEGHMRLEISSLPTDKIWVVFSHVNIPFGKFAQTRVIAQQSGHKLFLNCKDNSWYLGGIPGLARDLAGTIDALAELCAPLDAVVCGHSMGAFASMALGQKLERGRFIATSPEPLLGLSGSRSERNNVRDGDLLEILARCRAPTHAKKRGMILFGAYDPVDCYFLADADVWSTYGNVIAVPYHHGVTEFFTKNRIYYDLLNGDPIELNSLRMRGYLHEPDAFGTARQYRHFYNADIAFKANAGRSSLMEFVQHEADWDNPGWQSLRAMIFRSLDDPEQALEAAWRAYRYQPDETTMATTLCRLGIETNNRQIFRSVIDGLTPRQRQENAIVNLLEAGTTRFAKAPAQKIGDGTTRPSPDPVLSLGGTFDALSEHIQHSFTKRIRDMFEQRKYPDVLHATAGFKDGVDGGPSTVLAMRALALVRTGEIGAAIRLVRAASARAPIENIVISALIETAYRSKNGDLVWQYFDMELTEDQRTRHVDLMARCFEFVTEEHLIDRLANEYLTYEGDGPKIAARRQRALGYCQSPEIRARLEAHFATCPLKVAPASISA